MHERKKEKYIIKSIFLSLFNKILYIKKKKFLILFFFFLSFFLLIFFFYIFLFNDYPLLFRLFIWHISRMCVFCLVFITKKKLCISFCCFCVVVDVIRYCCFCCSGKTKLLNENCIIIRSKEERKKNVLAKKKHYLRGVLNKIIKLSINCT